MFPRSCRPFAEVNKQLLDAARRNTHPRFRLPAHRSDDEWFAMGGSIRSAEPLDEMALAAAMARDSGGADAEQDDGGADERGELHLPGWLILTACAISALPWLGLAMLAAWAWRG